MPGIIRNLSMFEVDGPDYQNGYILFAPANNAQTAFDIPFFDNLVGHLPKMYDTKLRITLHGGNGSNGIIVSSSPIRNQNQVGAGRGEVHQISGINMWYFLDKNLNDPSHKKYAGYYQQFGPYNPKMRLAVSIAGDGYGRIGGGQNFVCHEYPNKNIIRMLPTDTYYSGGEGANPDGSIPNNLLNKYATFSWKFSFGDIHLGVTDFDWVKVHNSFISIPNIDHAFISFMNGFGGNGGINIASGANSIDDRFATYDHVNDTIGYKSTVPTSNGWGGLGFAGGANGGGYGVSSWSVEGYTHTVTNYISGGTGGGAGGSTQLWMYDATDPLTEFPGSFGKEGFPMESILLDIAVGGAGGAGGDAPVGNVTDEDNYYGNINVSRAGHRMYVNRTKYQATLVEMLQLPYDTFNTKITKIYKDYFYLDRMLKYTPNVSHGEVLAQLIRTEKNLPRESSDAKFYTSGYRITYDAARETYSYRNDLCTAFQVTDPTNGAKLQDESTYVLRMYPLVVAGSNESDVLRLYTTDENGGTSRWYVWRYDPHVPITGQVTQTAISGVKVGLYNAIRMDTESDIRTNLLRNIVGDYVIQDAKVMEIRNAAYAAADTWLNEFLDDHGYGNNTICQYSKAPAFALIEY